MSKEISKYFCFVGGAKGKLIERPKIDTSKCCLHYYTFALHLDQIQFHKGHCD